VALSAVDVISPAFEHMKRQLFSPFRAGQWVRLAVVGLLAGELGVGNFGTRFPSRGGGSSSGQSAGGIGPIPPGGILFAVGIAILVLLVFVAAIALLYVSSRMRFVLFDSVIAGECSIRRFWNGRGQPAWRYFVFQILFGFCTAVGMAILIGLPLLGAFAAGWFRNPREHLLPLILCGVVLLCIFLTVVITLAVVQVVIKDFVIPQMALEEVTVGEGWRRVWALMKAEKGGYAGYLGMKLVLATAAAVVLGIVTLIAVVIVLIPVGGAGALAVLAGRAAGLAWNPVTLALAIVVGILVVVSLLLIMALISVPAIVFFPAYSIRFFAERYPLLKTALLNTPSPQP